jgi:hypothetical protein
MANVETAELPRMLNMPRSSIALDEARRMGYGGFEDMHGSDHQRR